MLDALRQCSLIASVQAPAGTPLDSPDPILRMARASLAEGVRVLRLQGVANIEAVRAGCPDIPTIGLIKRDYPDSPIYITPTEREVDELVATGTEVIALDGTPRRRPSGAGLAALIARIHAAGCLAMADCDSLESAQHAASAGADFLGTTLAGYTETRTATPGPDLALLREVVALGLPTIAEGRYDARWQVEAALRIGATAVVVGGALNDPLKNTRALMPRSFAGRVGAVDIGGTWLRFAVVSEGIESVERVPLPPTPDERLAWIREQIARSGVGRVGISTGGTVDPRTGVVWEAKPIIPGHQGSEFSERTLGVPTVALNDGLATAWGHAQHPRHAGRRVATLALGTGVGCGLVDQGRLWMGPRGEYIRLNDQLALGGHTYEDLLGGAALSPNPTNDQMAKAQVALDSALAALRGLYFPEVIVLAGAVGLAGWLDAPGTDPTPYGHEAGLWGAAMLAKMPPPGTA